MDKDITLPTLASAILYTLSTPNRSSERTDDPCYEAYTEFNNTIESYDLQPRVNGDGTVDITFYQTVKNFNTCKEGDVFQKVYRVSLTLEVIEEKYEE